MSIEIAKIYAIVLVLTILCKWIFATIFHFGIKSIIESHMDTDTEQTYAFFKYFSWIVICLQFFTIFLWDKIGFIYLPIGHQGIILLFSGYLLYYLRSSMKLMSHLINIIYFPHLAGEKEYASVFGDIKLVDDKYYFIHDSSKTNIDITKRV